MGKKLQSIITVSLFSLSAQGQNVTYPKHCYGSDKNNCRPPQFVAIAFDGSKNLSMWKETRAFANANNANFTYFISGVYLLGKSVSDSKFSYKRYKKPGSSRSGLSNIGFGKDLNDIGLRSDQIVRAHLEGNEIASHAMGHFYGGAPNRWKRDALNWNRAEWNLEFSQFDTFLDQALSYFSLKSLFRSSSDKDKVVKAIVNGVEGFRAPQLSANSSMWSALNDHDFSYDTSEIEKRSYWPKKKQGIWKFPLASIPVPGQRSSILSMDYNLKVKGVSEQSTYQAYIDYFKYNYRGNRAPVHIGHHFSKWNGGAYWKALQRFVKSVCKLPEVVCGSYRQLRYFMESVPSEVRTRWEKKNFEPARAVGIPVYALASKGLGDLSDNPNWRPEEELTESEKERLSKVSCFDEASAHE